jgi:hypothetical protein
MNDFRRYILTLGYHSEITLSEFSIPENVSEYAQNIFVEMRKHEAENMANNGTASGTQ